MAEGAKIWQRDEADSPCVKTCLVHREAGLCTGCLRTIDKIASLSTLAAHERQSIMNARPDRRSEIANCRGGRKARRQQQS